jgi:EmrB/QacA subfamily drug resistance transporter
MAFYSNPPCDVGVLESGEFAKACTPATGKWVLAATILGSSLAFIDGTAVSVALPVMQKDLGASVTQMPWVVEAYALLLAALLLVGGAMGDKIGRKRVFGFGIALFALASVWGGLAPSAGQLIIARALQGVGGAMMVPASLAIISASFSDDDRGRAIGTWSGFTAITAAVGPVLGGWLVTNLSWRWVFFINVPIAIVVLVILAMKVEESRNEAAQGRIDWLGAALSTLGLTGLVYGLVESGSLGFSHPGVIASLAVGVGGLVAFVWLESRLAEPMMSLKVFKSKSFSGANALTFLLYGALGGSLFFLPFNLIQVQGYSATAAGAAWLPFIIIIAVLARWAGALIQKFGAKLPLVVGPAISAAGFALFMVPGIGGSYWTTFFPAILVLGLGMAISVAPLVTVVMGSVEQENAGMASGVNNAISRTASLLALAVFGVALLAIFNTSLDNRLDAISVPPSVELALEEQRENLAGAELPSGIDPTLARSLERAIDEAFVESFRWVMLIGALLALTASIVAMFSIENPRKPGLVSSSRAPQAA